MSDKSNTDNIADFSSRLTGLESEISRLESVVGQLFTNTEKLYSDISLRDKLVSNLADQIETQNQKMTRLVKIIDNTLVVSDKNASANHSVVNSEKSKIATSNAVNDDSDNIESDPIVVNSG